MTISFWTRARDFERFVVGLAHLLRRDALLQPVVARDEELLDPNVQITHRKNLAGSTFFRIDLLRFVNDVRAHSDR